MAYPVKPLVRPACLRGSTNGLLPVGILVETPGLAGGPVVRLVEPAARAWRAMAAEAVSVGVILKATSLSDSYRPYAVQERIFRQRYTTQYLPKRPYKIWDGRRWYQKPNTAMAAVPGQSNHGWALAVDTGTERDGDPGTESLNDATIAWLRANADRFGFSWEVQTEPWHLRYYRGDNIPSAVLAYEATPGGNAPVPVQEDDDMLQGYDKSEDDVARATVRELCDTHWGYGKMSIDDQNWLVGEWGKRGREHMMTLLLDHADAKKD